jgi:hypothetical protein
MEDVVLAVDQRHQPGRQGRRRRFFSFSLSIFLFIGVFVVVQFRLLVVTTNNNNNNVKDVHRLRDDRHNLSLDTPITSSEENRQSHSPLQWMDGCQQQSVRNIHHQDGPQAPTGLVVTMALAPKQRQHMIAARQQICNNLPNQWDWFLYPQGIDMLLVIQEESQLNRQWTVRHFADCLLNNKNRTTTQERTLWKNLNGSTLETIEYLYFGPSSSSPSSPSNRSISIFLASTKVKYPKYIRNDPSLLERRKFGPKGCSARLTYLQGNRWYTHEMLQLQIIQQYDYFFKIDTDIVFHRSPSFHVLQDMKRKGAIFGHTAEYYPDGDPSCATGLLDAVLNFTTQKQQRQQPSSLPSSWKNQICSATDPAMQKSADLYYCNFIIGNVGYFTSPWVLEFGTFLTNYPDGYFTNKWGDQVFWHFAMGLFVTSFRQYVADYTDLRCKANPQCWYSSMDVKKYGQNATEQCANHDQEGIFVHTKSLDYAMAHSITTSAVMTYDLEYQHLFQPLYTWNCTK